ncbi:MAG: hypothetical protein U9R27_04670 [Campylobacterota bacterium]|nr:hypothetical protein [Campylobacterota bacterium]
MLNKNYLPSLGFVILSTTVLSSTLLLLWALSPLSYEKALAHERSGHLAFKNGDLESAYDSFLSSAKIDDDNITRGRRYRYVATSLMAAGKDSEAIKYYKKAIILNANDEVSLREYKRLESHE